MIEEINTTGNAVEPVTPEQVKLALEIKKLERERKQSYFDMVFRFAATIIALGTLFKKVII